MGERIRRMTAREVERLLNQSAVVFRSPGEDVMAEDANEVMAICTHLRNMLLKSTDEKRAGSALSTTRTRGRSAKWTLQD